MKTRVNHISKFYALLLCVSFTFTANSQNTCTANNGNWGSPSTWNNCSGTIPQNGDIVKIPDNVTVTVNSTNQYSANGAAPFLNIYVGDDDNDGQGGTISFNGKLNLLDGSTFVVFQDSKTTDDAPGSSEKIRWWESNNGQIASLDGSDVAFTGPVTVTNGVVTSGIFDPLPIELVSFSVTPDNGQMRVNWTTSIEENNAYFTIERAFNNVNYWEAVGFVEGSGNTNYLISYSYIDTPENTGTYYYRLKQTDFDGKYTYSDVVVVRTNETGITASVYPNPTEGKFTIRGSFMEKESVRMFNSNGNEIDITSKANQLSEQSITVDASSVPSGLYYLIVGKDKVMINIQ